MSKNSFILYQSQCEIIANLDDDIRLKLYDSIINFAFKDVIPEKEDKLFFALFSIFRDQIDRDSSKYAEKCIKRAEAGKKGGIKSGEIRAKQTQANEANASKTKQTQANEAENDNDNDNENDNENENDKIDMPISKNEISEVSQKKVKEKKNPYAPDFENFWVEYLSKTKRSPGSKSNAFREWKKITKEERSLSIEKVSSYQSASSMGEFMKDAERYLKSKLWESFDESVLKKFGIPQNTKTGVSTGRNLPVKKTWEEFVSFCEKHTFTFGMDLKEIYPVIEFDQWGDYALKNRLWAIKKQGKGV